MGKILDLIRKLAAPPPSYDELEEAVRGEKKLIYKEGSGGSESVEVIEKIQTVSFLSAKGSVCQRKIKLLLPAASKGPFPLIISVHYETPPENMFAFSFLKLGWAYMTPVDIPEECLKNTVADDMRFSMALISAAKRDKDILLNAIGIRGGSAGGHHVLMLSSFLFGICGAYSASGVTNLSYNLGRFIPLADMANSAARNSIPENEREDAKKYPLPSVRSIASGFAPTAEYLGMHDPESRRWALASPVTYAKGFSQPIIFSHSTADLIVPINQVTEKHACENAEKLMPKGCLFRLEDIMKTKALSAPLDEILDSSEQCVYRISPPEEGETLVMKFDPEKRYHFNYVDEGVPEPGCDHFKDPRSAAFSDIPFWEHYLKLGAENTNILNSAKMMTLAKRFHGTLEYFQSENGQKSKCDPSLLGSVFNDRVDVLLEISAYLGIDIHRGASGLENISISNLECLIDRLSELPPQLQMTVEAPKDYEPKKLLSELLGQLMASAAKASLFPIAHKTADIIAILNRTEKPPKNKMRPSWLQ